jgi:polyhydroxyalkanoate synthesis regulator phasin
MPASKSSSSSSSRKAGGARSGRGSTSHASGAASNASSGTSKNVSAGASKPSTPAGAADATRPEGFTSLIEQLVNYVINPLGLVVLTRERIQDTLDDAAARGRLTRTDATELAAELVRRGRAQTEELLGDAERLIGRGRDQFESATVRSRFSDGVDRIVRTADRARRTVGVGSSFPIIGYDDLTAAQINSRLKGLSSTELRRVREYERRHANRKSVLDAVERALS